MKLWENISKVPPSSSFWGRVSEPIFYPPSSPQLCFPKLFKPSSLATISTMICHQEDFTSYYQEASPLSLLRLSQPVIENSGFLKNREFIEL